MLTFTYTDADGVVNTVTYDDSAAFIAAYDADDYILDDDWIIGDVTLDGDVVEFDDGTTVVDLYDYYD